MSGIYEQPTNCSPRAAVDRFTEELTVQEALVVNANLEGRFRTPFGDPVAFDILEAAAHEVLRKAFRKITDKVDAMTGLKTWQDS